MAVELKVGIDQKHWLREVERGRKMAEAAMKKSGSGLKLKIDEKGFRQPLGRISGDLKQFDSALAASNARVIAFGASTAVIGGISKAFRDLAKTTVEVGKQFADINRILQLSSKGLEKFGNQLFEISKKNATSFEDSAKAALEFARQGLKTEESLKRTADALTLVRLTGINADKAVSSLTATVNAFDSALVTTSSSVNKFVAVETKFAVGARDLVEAIGRVGSSAKDAKVGFDELNAMVTSVQQTTGRGGAVIGNAMKTIFTRLQRQSTLDALESYNVAVKDVEGSTLPAIQILNNFAKSYKGLKDNSKAYLREQVAGVFQANILSAILRDLNKSQPTFAAALKVSTAATNEADLATAQLNKTLSALATQTGLEFKRLQENIGKSTFEPIAKAVMEPLKGLMMGINDVIDGEGAGSEIANGLLKGIKNVIGGPGLIAIIGVLGKVFINTTGYLLKSLPALAGIVTQTQKRAQLEEIISAAMSQEASLTKQIKQNEGNAAVQAGIFAGHAEAAKEDLKSQAKSVTDIANALLRMPKGTVSTVVAASGGKTGKRGASGFIPGMAGEAHDISRGVGGVSSSSKPVAIPNFSFGGGARGTMVANTGEYVVPNFKSGGSAIFNPNMVAQYGMPSGAKPIRGAGGYVPNFADINRADAMRELEGMSLQGRGYSSGDKNRAAEIGGMFGLKGTSLRSPGSVLQGVSRKGETKAVSGKFLDATSVAHMLIPQAGAKHLRHPHIFGRGKGGPSKGKMLAKSMTGKDVDGVILNAYGPSPTASKKVQGGGNMMEVEKILDDSLRMAAENVIMAYHPSLSEIPIDKKKIESSFLREGGEGAMGAFKGALFEAIVTRLIKQPQEKGKSRSSTLDVNLGHPTAGPRTRDLFGIPKTDKAGFADLKSSWSSGNRSKIVEQIIKNFGPSGMLKVTSAAQGYIPNFAALGDSVEREAAAGVPVGSIRVGRSSRLAGPNNPAGLGVTNTRDEPRGLKDVVGASRGYVPNYVDSPGVDLGGVVGKANKKLSGLTNGFDRFQKAMDKVALKLSKKEITEEQAMKSTARLGRAAGKSGKDLTVLGTRVKTTSASMAAASGGAGIRGKMSALNKRMGAGGMGGMGIGMGLSMGAPMLAGALEQGFGEGNATGQVLSGGLTGAGTGAAMGMMFGPLGAAIGGVGGALIGLTTSAMDAGKSLEQLERETKEYDSATESNTTAAREYIQAQRDLVTAITPEELENAQKRLTKNFDAITNVELQKSFADAGTNVTDMIEKLKNYELMRQGGAIVGKAAVAASRAKMGSDTELWSGIKNLFGATIGKDRGAAFTGKNRYFKQSVELGADPNSKTKTMADEFSYSLDEVGLGNIRKDYGAFFGVLQTYGDKQLKLLDEMLAEESGEDAFFDASRIADKLIEFQGAFKQADQANLENLFQDLMKATGGRFFRKDEENQDFQGFLELMEAVSKAAQKSAKVTVGINNKAKEAQENFTRIKSGITRLTETLGAMAKSLDGIKKVRKAFSGERVDLLGKAGQGLSIGGFAQAQSRAQFGDDRAKLTATTAAANATKIMTQIQTAGAAVGDIEQRALKDAAELFTTNIEKGLDAFAKFHTVNTAAQEGINKLINKLRLTYKDQLKNIELDEKITEAKIQLEHKRRENIEREAIGKDAMGSMTHGRSMDALGVDATRRRTINILQEQGLNDPRKFRGSGFRTQGAGIAARGGIEQQIAEIEFQRQKASAVEAGVKKVGALLLEKQKMALDKQLLDSTFMLNNTLQELILEYQKLGELGRLGPEPTTGKKIENLNPTEYQAMLQSGMSPEAWSLKQAKGSYHSKRGALIKSQQNRKAPRADLKSSSDFNFVMEQAAAEQLAGSLKGIKTQKDVMAKLDEESAKINAKDEKDITQQDEALERRINALKRELELGTKRLDTEKEISDEMRNMVQERKISLDTDARSFKTQFKEGMLDIFEETDYIYARLGKELPMAFRDGMVGAMEAAMDKADSFGDAMKGVAVDMLKMIRRAALEHSMSNFTNLLGMGTKGFRTSQHGSIVPGSGTGDKVPTMLEPGEYVMNRKAVKGIGKTNLDNMNFGAFPRFAEGGSMMLNESATSNRMSGFFLASDNPELMEAREKARADYEKKQAKKAEKRQLLSSFLSTVASVGMGKLMDMGASKFREKFGQKNPATVKGPDGMTMHRNIGSGGAFYSQSAVAGRPETAFDSWDKWGPGRQRGGHIGQGFSNRDSVPAYMAGGEFVMNSRAVRKYGTGFMGRLNGGLIPSMQAGGAVGGAPAPLNTQTGANTNNISINVNMGGGGGAAGQGASDSSGNANASEQSNVDQSTRAKELGERIRSSVLQVITEEQRLGGSLSKKSRG